MTVVDSVVPTVCWRVTYTVSVGQAVLVGEASVDSGVTSVEVNSAV